MHNLFQAHLSVLYMIVLTQFLWVTVSGSTLGSCREMVKCHWRNCTGHLKA